MTVLQRLSLGGLRTDCPEEIVLCEDQEGKHSMCVGVCVFVCVCVCVCVCVFMSACAHTCKTFLGKFINPYLRNGDVDYKFCN